LVPGRTSVERVLHGTKRVLPANKNSYSTRYPMGTAEEPFKVLDITFFSKSLCKSNLLRQLLAGELVEVDDLPGQ
jgi:hypothetical protein